MSEMSIFQQLAKMVIPLRLRSVGKGRRNKPQKHPNCRS
jgi:hypothetical protein